MLTNAYALVVLAAVAAAGRVERRDGSTITVSTTQFNPALTNQGGTTNAAGTFNVSPLATSTSYMFQTLSQTSTFALGPVNTQAASSGNSGSGNSGNSGNSGSGNSGNVGGGTIVVTATAPTSTVNRVSTGGGVASSTGVATASNGLPSLALGATNAAVGSGVDRAVYAGLVAVGVGAVLGALVVV
ncbi:conserved hypothetical protein [Sporisorium reilianum SRZ2]|uniref:Uncharacterized protein n=1 Tax=Sporisorium reilianum (strain SRZ2) TaxID=999809 RepID=E7A021_SPORE|nr:conserved hypothetical protein [Sporisorium reilianum SRZ2]